jgi:ribosomal protein L30/L7E
MPIRFEIARILIHRTRSIISQYRDTNVTLSTGGLHEINNMLNEKNVPTLLASSATKKHRRCGNWKAARYEIWIGNTAIGMQHVMKSVLVSIV